MLQPVSRTDCLARRLPMLTFGLLAQAKHCAGLLMAEDAVRDTTLAKAPPIPIRACRSASSLSKRQGASRNHSHRSLRIATVLDGHDVAGLGMVVVVQLDPANFELPQHVLDAPLDA